MKTLKEIKQYVDISMKTALDNNDYTLNALIVFSKKINRQINIICITIIVYVIVSVLAIVGLYKALALQKHYNELFAGAIIELYEGSSEKLTI